MAEPVTSSRDGRERARHWNRRPWSAWTVRALVVLVPIALALLASIAISRALPRPTTTLELIGCWAAILAGALAVLIAADVVCRRALPLAALLELTLLFPDRAPRRFRVWRQGGSAAQLRAELDALSRQGDHSGPAAIQHVLTLVAALAVHDARTRGHAERVRVLTDMLAEEMHLPDAERHRLRWAALLHDIGKLSVRGEILRKPGPPDDAEWEALRRHPEEGDRLLGAVRPWLGLWASTVEHHHEHYDGTGYPHGLRGDQISLGGRIVGLADAFEAMTARRPYSRPLSPAAARAELVQQSGAHFDPDVCRAFLGISVGRLWRAVGISALFAQVPVVAAVSRLGNRVDVSAGMTAGGAVATGAVALALGTVSVAGVEHLASSPARGAVAAVSTGQQAVPAPPPAPVEPRGLVLHSLTPTDGAPPPTASPTPDAAAPVVIAILPATSGRGSAGGGGGSGPSPLTTVDLSLSPPRGSVHRQALFDLAGTVGGCGTCSVLVDFGDGSAPVSAALDGGTFAVTHTYAVKGRYDVDVAVVDGATTRASSVLRVVINNG